MIEDEIEKKKVEKRGYEGMKTEKRRDKQKWPPIQYEHGYTTDVQVCVLSMLCLPALFVSLFV